MFAVVAFGVGIWFFVFQQKGMRNEKKNTVPFQLYYC